MIITAPSASPDASKSPWKEMGALPTTEQIATIAAMLARNITDKPSVLADAAMDLWLATRERIHLSQFENEIDCQNLHLNGSWDFIDDWALLDEREYPIARDCFLRIMLPKYKSRAAELARIAKAFVRDTLRERSEKEPTLDEVSDAYSRWKPYETPNAARNGEERFHRWYDSHISTARRLAGLKSGAKRRADKRAGIKPKRRAKKAPSKKTERKSLDAF